MTGSVAGGGTDCNRQRFDGSSGAPQAAALSRSRWWILGASAVSLVFLGVSAIIAVAWVPRLPGEVAVHWNASMEADGFSSPASFIGLTLGMMAGAILLLAAIGFGAGQSDALARVVIGTQLFLAGMGSLLVLTTLGIQRDMSSAPDVTLPWWALTISLVIPAVMGIAAAAIMPRTPVPDAPRGPANEAVGTYSEGATAPTWTGRTAMPAGLLWSLSSIIIAIFVWIALASGAWWWLAIAVPLAVVLILEGGYTIRIDEKGIRVRAWLGWPNTFITARQIGEAQVAEVHPFQEFGGWGYRVSLGGAVGIVLRKGPGLRIEYGDSSVLVVTVDEGAADAAAALNAVAVLARRG